MSSSFGGGFVGLRELGQQAGGEGLLGLQRAFQIAGARSTVASLRQVHSDATRQLMERMYATCGRRK